MAASTGGRYGRMFPDLRACAAGEPAIDELVALMRSHAGGGGQSPNRQIPAGYTYLGQFIDHDITFDPTSRLDRLNDPYALVNFRTPRLDLDSLYGRGPADQPFLYDWSWKHPGVKLLLDKQSQDACLAAVDLPRNSQQRALIGDARNDENVIISQLHMLFIRFHNRIVELLAKRWPPPEPWDLFDEAQRIVRWHYQWIVVHDFLEKVVGGAVAQDVLPRQGANWDVLQPTSRRRHYRWESTPFVPVEFSGAAFRFGHSMVRKNYVLAPERDAVAIFPPHGDCGDHHLGGFRRLKSEHEITWSKFFGPIPEAQPSMRIDHLLAPELFELPPDTASLPRLNLMRGRALGLPSGQDVAHAMGQPTLTPAELHLDDNSAASMPASAREALRGSTPLWYYVLCEAETSRFGEGGQHLGPVGGRIVAETLVGLLEADGQSYLRQRPRWLPQELAGVAADGDFTMRDLVSFALGTWRAEALFG